jgi:hypothetical protein
MRITLPALFFLLVCYGSAQQTNPPAASSTQAFYNAQVRSTQQKFDYIRQNGAKKVPDQKPTVLNENEVNAWLTSGNAVLPNGVKRLQFRGLPGEIHATATIDFDQITAGKRSGNPLLGLFSGTHEVQAKAHAVGTGGTGQVHIDSVSLDGVTVPRMALEFFVDKYIKPKYPNLGIDSTFSLPYQIDIAQVGARQLTVIQKQRSASSNQPTQ